MNRHIGKIVLTVAVAAIGRIGVADASGAVEWGYAHGTEGWGYLDPSFSACNEGLAQSPIDVIRTAAARRPLASLGFAYATAATVDVVDKGHTIQADVAGDDNVLHSGGKQYKLVQFHVHAPSENYLDGEQYPLEMHFVHQAADGSRAVVGVLYDEGPADATLQRVIAAVPSAAGGHTPLAGLNLRSLVPGGASYRFAGSLTTPPCSEGIAWHVMGRLRTASYAQLAAFAGRYSGEDFPGGNRRPVQPLNGRHVVTEGGGD